MNKVLFALSALAFVNPMYPQGYDNTTTVVIPVLEDIKPETKMNRSVASSSIECRYYVMTSTLELSFRVNLGNAYVTLENLATGETNYRSCDSSSGMMVMAVSPNSCYTMCITTDTGRIFRASFITSDINDD